MTITLNGSTGITSPEFIGSGDQLTDVAASSGPNGSPFSFRNKIINGSGLVSQRGVAVPLVAGGVYGADRWIHYCIGATGISAVCGADVGGLGGSSNRYVYTQGSWTGGAPGFQQRIEATETVGLNGKTVTISGAVYHNYGSTLTFNVMLYKANASDNFSGMTQVGATYQVSVPSGAKTSFSTSITLGASDASNGLALAIISNTAVTVTSKLFAITDVQLEAGPVATPFETRPYGTELALCQRYYTRAYAYQNTYITSGGNAGISVSMPTSMRATPTVSTLADGSANLSTVNYTSGGSGTTETSVLVYASGVSVGAATLSVAFQCVAEL